MSPRPQWDLNAQTVKNVRAITEPTTVAVPVYDHASGEVRPWVVSKKRFDALLPSTPEPEPMPEKNDYVCLDCATEKNTMRGTCDNCGSVRLSLISVVEENFGKDWRDNFEPNPDPVTKDHPEVKAAEELGRRFIASLKEDPL
jgi:hypothetical protein